MTSESLYAHGFVRVAACTVAGRVGDPSWNMDAVLAEAGANWIVANCAAVRLAKVEDGWMALELNHVAAS